MSSVASLSTVLRETSVLVDDAGVCTVLLNRPDRGNGYTNRMADELDWIFKAVNDDTKVKVVVLSGAGKRFCVGADLGRFSANEEPSLELGGRRDAGGVASLSIADCRKPVIAALHGAAIGIGITLVLPCDVRIAEEDTKVRLFMLSNVLKLNIQVGFLFAKRGLSIEASASYFLPKIVGLTKALEMCLTGRLFEARSEPGLFSHVVAPGTSLQRAKELAKEMVSSCSLVSLMYIKASLRADVSHPHDAHLIESQLIAQVWDDFFSF
jgi:enoyl-CoA hydratase/carnithine racemase